MKEGKKELKEHKKVKLSNKNILLIVIGIVLVSLAGTIAWFTWRSNDTALVLTVGDISSAQVTLKPYKINAELAPTTSYENEIYTNVTAVNNSTTAKKINLYYHINKIDSELISPNFKYTITKSTDNGSTYTEYKNGNFSTAANNIDLYIMEEEVSGNENIKYKVYIWLDGTNSNEGVAGKSFSGELRAEVTNIETPHYLYLIKESLGMGSCIKSITFMPNTNPPSGLTKEDAVDAGNTTEAPAGYEGQVLLYTVENGAGYDLYVGSTEGKVYAPPDSSSLFANDTCLETLNGMENFDTSSVTTMEKMFYGAINLRNLDVTHFNTSKVTDMTEMFSFWNDTNMDSGRMTTINLSSFDTKNVNSMYCMFENWCNLSSVDLSSFDTTNVTNMFGMFNIQDCEPSYGAHLTSINFGNNFKTSNVETMAYMFYGQKKLQGTFTIATNQIADTSYMFFYTAASAPSNFVINYNSVNASSIDDIINSGKTDDAKVVKGSCIDC